MNLLKFHLELLLGFFNTLQEIFLLVTKGLFSFFRLLYLQLERLLLFSQLIDLFVQYYLGLLELLLDHLVLILRLSSLLLQFRVLGIKLFFFFFFLFGQFIFHISYSRLPFSLQILNFPCIEKESKTLLSFS